MKLGIIILLFKLTLSISQSNEFVFFKNTFLGPTDCWNIEFNLQHEQRVYLLGSVKNKAGKEIANLRSETFRAKAGLNKLNRDLIKTVRIKYLDNEVESAVLQSGNFPKGSYELCTIIIDASNDSELDKLCRVDEAGEPLKKKDEANKKSNVNFYGSAAVDYLYSSPQSFYTEQPPSFVRVEAEQGLNVYSVPLSGQLRYTTEKTSGYQDMDMFALRFDRSRFERNIKDLILRKLAETQLQKVKENAEDLKLLTELEHIETQLKDESLELLNSKRIETENELKIYSGQKTESSQKKYNSLKKNYEKLIAAKRKLEKLKDRYNQLMKLKDTWIISGRWEELKNMAFNPPDLNDPKVIVSELQKYGAFTGINRFLFGIQELSIGTAYPVYTPLTLNGTQIFGANLEWNPGLIYFAACGGKIHSPVSFNSDSLSAQFKQSMGAVRIGLGKSYGTHFTFSLLKFWDSDKSLEVPAYIPLFPESSWVGSTEFAISIGKNRMIEWSGEVAGLFRNQNTNDSLAPVLSIQYQFIEENLKPNLSSSFDAAANTTLRFNLFKAKTRIEIKSEYTGPGFIHPGVFGLRNDIWKQDYRLKQFFSDNKFKLTGIYISERDNFSESKGITTFLNQYGLELEAYYKSFPQTKLSLNRIQLKNEIYTYKTNLVNLNVNKNYKLGNRLPANTNFNIMYYFTDTDSLTQKINSYYLSLQQFITLPSGFSLNLGAQYAKNNVASLFTQHSGFNVMIGKMFFNRLRMNIGVNYNSDSLDDKLGFNLNVSGAIINSLEFNFRAFQNQYSQYPGSNGRYKENYIQTGLKYNW